ncbi:DUF2855 family protein [Candidatus Litorirhabdus singularis]|nr:DUF2855 family protein [Candidatus Litorirhabdus singularis]
MSQDFLVNRSNLAEAKMASAVTPVAASGEAVLRVDKFALTANNITYGVAGDIIGYWNFFPAEAGWGRIPVWGIATVQSSEHPGMKVGDRFYGYFPMSTELLVKPERVTERGFFDAAEHRAELPIVYNQYSKMTVDNGFDPALDNHAMLYRPLFTTSFVLDDYLADNDFFGADSVILGSASSKTAFGLAFMLQRRGGKKVIGLTSAGNVDFCKGLGLYNEVLTYAEVESLPQAASAYVDMSGNGDVLRRLHHHLADNLLCSCGVGVTHHESGLGQGSDDMPGAKPQMFFAPSQIVKRNEELGPEIYQQQIGEATQAFLAEVDNWVSIEEHAFSDVDAVFHTILDGASPTRGYVITAG